MIGPTKPKKVTTAQKTSTEKKTTSSKRKINKSNFLMRSFYSNLKKDRLNSKGASSKNGNFFDDTCDQSELSERSKAKIKALEELKAEYEKEKYEEDEFVLSSDSFELGSDSDSDSSDDSLDSEDTGTDSEHEEPVEADKVGLSKDDLQRKSSCGTGSRSISSSREAGSGGGGFTELERLAMEEILRETKREAELAKEIGVWTKPVVPPTNKRFLRNMLVSTLRKPLPTHKKQRRPVDWYMKTQGEYGDKLWKDRHERTLRDRQRHEEEWRDYNNSSYYRIPKRQYKGLEPLHPKGRKRAATEEPSEREKYEAYKMEQKKLKKKYESEFNERKKKHVEQGHTYKYEKNKSSSFTSAVDTVCVSSDDNDEYLDFKDVHREDNDLRDKSTKDRSRRKDGSSEKAKYTKRKKHKKEKHHKFYDRQSGASYEHYDVELHHVRRYDEPSHSLDCDNQYDRSAVKRRRRSKKRRLINERYDRNCSRPSSRPEFVSHSETSAESE